MALASISEIEIGKIDGKNEFLEVSVDADGLFYEGFLMPENINSDTFISGQNYFIRGFRGTGKTSLLRWLGMNLKTKGFIGEIVLFKSDLSPVQKQEISKQVGIEWSDVASGEMELIQDFKESWRWFVFHKIGELILEHNSFVGSGEAEESFLKLLGLSDETPFAKVLGFMPRLTGSKIEISADVGFFRAELQGEIEENKNKIKVRLDALNSLLEKKIKSIKFNKKFYLLFDELEVFYSFPEQYSRDLRMIRDILFICDKFNRLFKSIGVEARIISAVRSEVLDAMGSEGEEVNRLVHDLGKEIAWHHGRRGMDHPLLQLIRTKIWASEDHRNIKKSDDPIKTYFPDKIQGMDVDKYLLDSSFYKPRDIVWRLSLAIESFPNANIFNQDTLDRTSNDYSSKLWDEVKYEMSAVYSDQELSIIEGVFSGKQVYFDLQKAVEWFNYPTRYSEVAKKLLSRRSVEQILHDLYRLGAIGNAFKVNYRQFRNRWVFRGEPTLLIDKQMEIHPALVHRLSASR